MSLNHKVLKIMSTHELRVMAIAAPQFVSGNVGSRALSSSDPASLYNACRMAAEAAQRPGSGWNSSNWCGTRADRRASVLLLHDAEQARNDLTRVLPALRPNLVLIGAMSICMAGAVACAEQIRDELGDDVLIVLGGRHVSETLWRDKGGVVQHHAASPLLLISQGRLPAVFDVVLSGDGEAVIQRLGDLVVATTRRRRSARQARFALDDLLVAEGDWIAGTVVGGRVHVVGSQNGSLPYADMPSPAEMFGVTTRFDTFGGLPTAHVFSDIGRGCIYDCGFCSERIFVTGAPRQFATSADRLHRQLAGAHRTIMADHLEADGSSAFIEDSTLLGWRPDLVTRFENRCAAEPVPIRFGGQATVDQILQRPDLVRRLAACGLEYIFVGVETPDPEAVGGFSKNIGERKGKWLDRVSRVFDITGEAGVRLGVSLLFGLGEGPRERDMLLGAVEHWGETRQLDTISMNWAVQHPLRGADGPNAYTYLDWALDPGPLLEVMRHFGEASTRYTIAGGTAPTMDICTGIVRRVDEVQKRIEGRRRRTKR